MTLLKSRKIMSRLPDSYKSPQMESHIDIERMQNVQVPGAFQGPFYIWG